MSEEKIKRPLRAVKILLNFIFLLFLIIIAVQNAKTVHVSILLWQGEISLSILVFIAGALGALVMLMFKIIKW